MKNDVLLNVTILNGDEGSVGEVYFRDDLSHQEKLDCVSFLQTIVCALFIELEHGDI